MAANPQAVNQVLTDDQGFLQSVRNSAESILSADTGDLDLARIRKMARSNVNQQALNASTADVRAARILENVISGLSLNVVA